MKPINLNQQRKARDRARAKAQADENAVRFGPTKAARVLDAARVSQASYRLSRQKFDDDQDS